jgi:hypothetical protein
MLSGRLQAVRITAQIKRRLMGGDLEVAAATLLVRSADLVPRQEHWWKADHRGARQTPLNGLRFRTAHRPSGIRSLPRAQAACGWLSRGRVAPAGCQRQHSARLALVR